MLFNLKSYLKIIYYRIKFRNCNINIHCSCKLAARGVQFEGCNVLNKNVVFYGNIGYGSYIGENSRINAAIGRYCSIASNVVTVSGVHPTKGFVSTHPCFFSTKKQAGFTYVSKNKFEEDKWADDRKHLVIIGNDVWIGSNVLLMPSIKIGDGAIIAAGSVVTKDVPSFSIVGGVPAKVIKMRFEEQQISILKKIRWWDQSEEWIVKNVDKFSDIRKFCEESV